MQAVISVFGDHADAQRALDSLVRQGFSREDLHIERDAGGTVHTGDGAEVHDRGNVSNFGYFLASLLGLDQPEHAGTYSEAVRRGGSVLVLDAHGDAEAERAASLLRGLGTADADKGGVRVIQRPSGEPMRELLRQRSQSLAGQR